MGLICLDGTFPASTKSKSLAAPAGRCCNGSGTQYVKFLAALNFKRIMHWTRSLRFPQILASLVTLTLCSAPGYAVTKKHHRRTAAAVAAHPVRIIKASVPAPSESPLTGVVRGGPWTEPTYADSSEGDNVDFEDLEIRRAAVEALGPYNGSIVVSDANTGRILSMVNQKVALGDGFQPCSTVKVSVALAALSEKVIDPGAKLKLAGTRMDLTYALAHSNNYFFATLGQKLGFEKVSHYSHLFGYGEKAGLDIAGEKPGHYPDAPPANGGVGMLTSFGEEISQTPLQFAALLGAVANGGTL